MIKIGDYVKLVNVYFKKNELKRYANCAYKVIDISEDDEVVMLDKNFLDNQNKLHISYTIPDIKTTRLNKLKSMLND